MGEIDNLGLLIRTIQGIYICYIKQGKLIVESYSDFLADKSNRFIKIRFKDKVGTIGEEREKKSGSSAKFMEKLTNINKQKNIPYPTKYYNSIDILRDYFQTMQMCSKNSEQIGKIDSAYPLCLDKKDKKYTYSRSLIVRTENE